MGSFTLGTMIQDDNMKFSSAGTDKLACLGIMLFVAWFGAWANGPHQAMTDIQQNQLLCLASLSNNV